MCINSSQMLKISAVIQNKILSWLSWREQNEWLKSSGLILVTGHMAKIHPSIHPVCICNVMCPFAHFHSFFPHKVNVVSPILSKLSEQMDQISLDLKCKSRQWGQDWMWLNKSELVQIYERLQMMCVRTEMFDGYSSESPAVQLWLVWCICINVQ